MFLRLTVLLGAVWILAVWLGFMPTPGKGFKWPWGPDPELASSAEFINRRAPYVADVVGALQSYGPVAVTGAQAKGRMLIIQLRLMSNIRPEMLEYDIFYMLAAQAAREMCGSSVTLEMLLKKQSTQFYYSDRSGKFVAAVLVDRHFCGFE